MKIDECQRELCEGCPTKPRCAFFKFLESCALLALDVFEDLPEADRTSKFTEMMVMLGNAVGILKKLGLEDEYLKTFPELFQKGVRLYLGSVGIEVI